MTDHCQHWKKTNHNYCHTNFCLVFNSNGTGFGVEILLLEFNVLVHDCVTILVNIGCSDNFLHVVRVELEK